MGWLDRIVHGFIMTFGITQPTPQNKRLANVFIGGLLLLMVVAMVGLLVFGVRALVK